MKGRSRRWFWGALAVLLVTLAAQYAVPACIPLLAPTVPAGTLVLLAGALVALTAGGMAAVLLGYALGNTVKAHKVLFIILACVQLPVAAGGFIERYGMVLYAMGSAEMSSALAMVKTGISVAVMLAWAACLLIIALQRTTGGGFRLLLRRDGILKAQGICVGGMTAGKGGL